MIVSTSPRAAHAWRGVARPLVLLFAWDVVVTALWYAYDEPFEGIELQFSLFGSAIALFIGFAVNASYARWWEARSLWGLVINGSRNLARQALTLVDDEATGNRIVHAQIAYVHVLRTSLRGQTLPAEAEVHLPVVRFAALRSVGNPQNAILTAIGRLAQQATRAGALDPYARVRIETTLVDLANAQGGLERIKNTPLPIQYRVFPALFAQLFCLVLPVAIVPDLGIWTPVGSTLVGVMFLMAVHVGRDLANPFEDDVNDVPMTSMTRTVEIDLLQMLGKPAPDRVEPVDHVVW